jgi:hypothetical protein
MGMAAHPMKLYLTADKELLERTAREGFGVYWREFKREMVELECTDENLNLADHVLFERIWPPDDDESCLEFTIELTPQQIQMYDCRAANSMGREFDIPFELLVHAPIRLLTEAEIIAGIRDVLDMPDPRDGHTYRESILKDLAAGKATRYERAALEEDEQ